MGRLHIFVIAVGLSALVACGSGSTDGDKDVVDPGDGDVIANDVVQPIEDTVNGDLTESDLADDTVGSDEGESADVPDDGEPDVALVCEDFDGDGYGPGCENGPDCDPSDSFRFRLIELYEDGDYDAFGVGDPVELCIGTYIPAGWADVDGDCDDRNPLVCPGCVELADDGVANGCEGDDLVAKSSEGIFVVQGAPEGGAGTSEDPVGTIKEALTLAKTSGVRDVFVSEGTFNESIMIASDVAIHGGYNPTTWDLAGSNTYIKSVGAVGVRVMDASVVLLRLIITGPTVSSGKVLSPQVGALLIEGGQATIVDSTVSGGYFNTDSADDSLVLSVTALWIIDSDVTAVNSNVYLEDVTHTEDFPLTSSATRQLQGTAILLESGRLLFNGSTVDAGLLLTLNGGGGSVSAKTNLRGLVVDRGVATVAGSYFRETSSVIVKDVDAVDGVAKVDLVVDSTGMEVSGGGHLQVVNTEFSAGKGYANGEINVTGPDSVDASYDSEVLARAIRVDDGSADLVNNHISARAQTFATGDCQHLEGSCMGTGNAIVRLLDVGPQGRVRILNNYFGTGYDGVRSAFIGIEDGGKLRSWDNAFWAGGHDVCKIHNVLACVVDSTASFADCPSINGCEVFVDYVTSDPLYVYVDEVNPGSPLIDAGIDPSLQGLGAPTDMLYRDRPAGTTWDIGPIEFATPQ